MTIEMMNKKKRQKRYFFRRGKKLLKQSRVLQSVIREEVNVGPVNSIRGRLKRQGKKRCCLVWIPCYSCKISVHKKGLRLSGSTQGCRISNKKNQIAPHCKAWHEVV